MKIFNDVDRNERMEAWVLVSIISLFPWTLIMEHHSVIPNIMVAQGMGILVYGLWKEYFKKSQ